MDELNRWLDNQTQTPVGALLMFLLVFLMRVAADNYLRARREKRERRKREKPA